MCAWAEVLKVRSGHSPVLTDVCGEGDLVDGGIQVDDVWRRLQQVKLSRQPLQGDRHVKDGDNNRRPGFRQSETTSRF